MSWDELYGMLMANCGYTYEYIDRHMTLPKLAALTAYWKVVPPIDGMVAAIAKRMGIEWDKPAIGKPPPKGQTDEQLLAIARAEAAMMQGNR